MNFPKSYSFLVDSSGGPEIAIGLSGGKVRIAKLK